MKILFIGIGKMANIFINNFDQYNLVDEFFLYNRTVSKAETLSKNLKHKNSVLKNLDKIPTVDFIFLAVKPQNINEVGELLKGQKLKGVTLISLLAGTSIKEIYKNTNIENIVRVMPNTAIAKNSGCSTIYFNEQITEKIKKEVEMLLSRTGQITILNSEEAIDKVTPINGSAPAIIFELASYMVDYLKAQGIDANLARKTVTATFLGAAKLMDDSPKSLEELVNEVTSKGGSTIKALSFYRDQKLNEIIINGLNESYKRVRELGNN
ncbi:MAG: pyrroline-5-carboxylate reductase dimerization domain-containing protein [Bacteriovoracaceae bacterium]